MNQNNLEEYRDKVKPNKNDLSLSDVYVLIEKKDFLKYSQSIWTWMLSRNIKSSS